MYASDDLARISYFGLSVAERGLLDSMARAYWVSGSVPKDPRLLALVVRLPEADVKVSLTPAVLEHFQAAETDANSLHHIELRRQLQNIALVRDKQSEGGAIGAQMTNDGRRKRKRSKASQTPTPIPATTPAGTPAPLPASLGRVPERTELKELNCKEQSLGSAVDLAAIGTGSGNGSEFINGATQGKSPKSDRWIADYETVEQTTAEAYRRQSRGE